MIIIAFLVGVLAGLAVACGWGLWICKHKYLYTPGEKIKKR